MKNRILFWILGCIMGWFGRDGVRAFLGCFILLGSLLAFVAPADAQQKQPVTSVQPNCQSYINVNVVANVPQAPTTGQINNQQVACNGWILKTGSGPGISAISIRLESAPAGVNFNTPGAFVAFAGTVDGAYCANPCLTHPGQEIRATGTYPWVQWHVISATGSGLIAGELAGYPVDNAPVSVTVLNPSSGGCAGTTMTPCEVDLFQVAGTATVTGGVAGLLAVGGPDASGATNTANPIMVQGPDPNGSIEIGNPVLVGGIDVNTSSTVAPLSLDNNENLFIAPQAAAFTLNQPTDGIALLTTPWDTSTGTFITQPSAPLIWNGTTWDRTPGNTLGAFVQGKTGMFPLYVEGDPIGTVAVAAPIEVSAPDFNTGLLNSMATDTGFLMVEPISNISGFFYNCTLSAPVTSAAGLQVIIPGSGSTTTRLCVTDISWAAAVDFQVVEGTTSMTPCDTGAVNLTGLYKNVTSWSTVFGPGGSLQTKTPGDDLCLSVSAATAGGGWWGYAQF